ncbi:hypothetical protein ZWY2020_004352 [Hordeum vulgare]|uniref:Predicted protein n=1 Tax=Hordeum vulgare subsp. vulgare TaxID=112509 RepID=F2D3B4_HORVV|nr:hypothetical protein ZWY2020_004352 [Hordeum vulgare]BAJ89585.1 predicted protein [Hordeum vulgare subsp. vulgare]
MRRTVRACGGELRRHGPRYMYISLFFFSLSLSFLGMLTSICSSSDPLCFVCVSFFVLCREAVSDAF